MAKPEEMQKVQEKLAEEIPQFIAGAIVSVDDGMAIAGATSSPDIDLSIPAGYFSEAFRGIRKAFEANNWGAPKEVLVVGEELNILLIDLKPGEYFQGIAVKSEVNIGFVRAVIKKYKDEILNTLP